MTGPPGAHLVGYRALTREDFQAVGLPEHRGEPHGRLGAFLCAGIYPAAESRLVPEPVFTADGRILYRMAARDLSYRAMMDPGCSWWNPAGPDYKPAYVLAHEQVHFAIEERAARRLTVRVNRVIARAEILRPTAEEGLEEARDLVRAILEDELQRTLAEHLAFDNETSAVFDPERQAVWLKRLEADLAAGEP
jgi:hypothetical protein